MVLEHKFRFQKWNSLIYVLITTNYLRPEVQADKGNYTQFPCLFAPNETQYAFNKIPFAPNEIPLAPNETQFAPNETHVQNETQFAPNETHVQNETQFAPKKVNFNFKKSTLIILKSQL